MGYPVDQILFDIQLSYSAILLSEEICSKVNNSACPVDSSRNGAYKLIKDSKLTYVKLANSSSFFHT